MRRQYTLDDIKATYKPRDAWWTVLIIDPIAGRLLVPIANRTSLRPIHLTFIAAIAGLVAALCFWQATPIYLVWGAIAFHISFIFDCMDGKLARLKSQQSFLGTWVDFFLDRTKDIACTIGLFGGLFHATDNNAYLYLGFVFLTLNFVRYLNAAQAKQLTQAMSAALDAHRGSTDSPKRTSSASPSVKTTLAKYRIRLHLFSGIEYQMSVFVIAPLLQAGWGWGVQFITLAGAVLILMTEIAVGLRVFAATRSTDLALGSRDPE